MARITFNLNLYREALVLGKQLQVTFPKCFFPIGQEKPLKTGIFHDLIAKRNALSPIPNKKVLRAFMMIYTSSISYRASLITPNAIRVDLNGNECEPVTAKERYKAKITTRKIIWTLERDGYEAEQAKAKAKLKEQSKKPKETAKPESKIITKKEIPDDANKKNPHNRPTPSISKKSVPVVVKKKRNISPKDPKLH